MTATSIAAPAATASVKVSTSPTAQLLNACYDGDLNMVRELLAQEPQLVRALDEDERCALHWACTGGRVDVARLLLENGAAVDALDESAWTPLHIAASLGNSELLRLLVGAGADVDAQTETGQTALHFCCSKNHMDCCRLLLPLVHQVQLDNNGQSPLHRACVRGNVAVVKLLLSDATQLSLLTVKDKDGNSALHMACESDSGDTVSVLLDALNGGTSLLTDSSSKNRSGQTPFDLCSKSLKAYVQHLQLQFGA